MHEAQTFYFRNGPAVLVRFRNTVGLLASAIRPRLPVIVLVQSNDKPTSVSTGHITAHHSSSWRLLSKVVKSRRSPRQIGRPLCRQGLPPAAAAGTCPVLCAVCVAALTAVPAQC